jgi:Na+(H+)/acetate symporter ActP
MSRQASVKRPVSQVVCLAVITVITGMAICCLLAYAGGMWGCSTTGFYQSYLAIVDTLVQITIIWQHTIWEVLTDVSLGQRRQGGKTGVDIRTRARV